MYRNEAVDNQIRTYDLPERYKLSGYYSKHLKHNITLAQNVSMQQTRINKTIENLLFICEKQQKEEEERRLKDEWNMVSSVMDRIFLIIYILVNIGIVVFLIVHRVRHESFVYPKLV
uniref:Neurotransmitter-gated ion-channel transmembrane domain-containing protein n=1 Tax=Ciona savignyi TaxID=51511 RepID=H2YV26_CIOSA